MSIGSLAGIVGSRADRLELAGTPRVESLDMADVLQGITLPDKSGRAAADAEAARTAAVPPTATQLLATVGKYIPADVSAMWIAVAGGIATLNPPLDRFTRLNLVIGVAVLSSFATWVLVHQTLRARKPRTSLWKSLKAGSYEIAAAGIAFFVWGTAMPGSWYDFGTNAAFMPLLLVGAATIVIGGGGILLNREGR